MRFEEFLAAGAADPGGRRSPAGPRVLSVSDVTRTIRDVVRSVPTLADVWVEGEVGSVSVSAAGHAFLTLRDDRTQLRAVIFRDVRLSLPFEPMTGHRIVAHGRIDLYEQQGAYQLYVDAIQPAGFGDLAIRFEQLKARLAAEGLFEVARKRPLPRWPERIGVVTSPTGAVLHDIVKVLGRRWPLVTLVLSPTLVQGPGAPAAIVEALTRIGRWRDPADGQGVDLVIVARGGGSLEDLWSFNDEAVVRAIASHPQPTIVGVGHETDTTLAEFAADVRAATPSVAAELAVPSRDEQAREIAILARRLAGAASAQVAAGAAALDAQRRSLDGYRPALVVAHERERAGALLDRGAAAIALRLAEARREATAEGTRLWAAAGPVLAERASMLAAARASLEALGPLATLERGYAIVRGGDGHVLTDPTAAPAGSPLRIRLAGGSLDARSEGVRDSRP